MRNETKEVRRDMGQAGHHPSGRQGDSPFPQIRQILAPLIQRNSNTYDNLTLNNLTITLKIKTNLRKKGALVNIELGSGDRRMSYENCFNLNREGKKTTAALKSECCSAMK